MTLMLVVMSLFMVMLFVVSLFIREEHAIAEVDDTVVCIKI